MQNNIYSSEELKKFAAMANQWWDPNGPCKPLHGLNPLRLSYIENLVNIENKSVLDIGCGGGILSESMAQKGANVTAIDLAPELISVAKLHLLESKLKVDYQLIDVLDMAKLHPEKFDVITCMEMLEHVPDPLLVVQQIKKLLKPQGLVFFSTLNRNLKSYIYSILGAEYFLKLLPKGTHDYEKFIRPSELTQFSRKNQLTLIDLQGVAYNPLNSQFSFTEDISVNYLACFKNDIC